MGIQLEISVQFLKKEHFERPTILRLCSFQKLIAQVNIRDLVIIPSSIWAVLYW